MNHRERVLRTCSFAKTDRPPCDLMEGILWPEIREFFRDQYNLNTDEEIFTYLDTDFRWLFVEQVDLQSVDRDLFARKYMTYSDHTVQRPLADVHSAAELELAYQDKFNPENYIFPDYAAARRRWPEHAIITLSRIPSLFMTACTDFGMEECLVKMVCEPDVMFKYMEKLQEHCLQMIPYALHNAGGNCDICWLMDDIASQEDLIMSPDLWRKYIKPRLAEQVKVIKQYGQLVFFHSCGSVYSVIPDLIEIGIDALLVFQTTARNMDPSKIASEFGGRLAFYGGIDVQKLLRLATPEEVRRQVRLNHAAFAGYGGYMIANSHHCISDIKGENLIAMCRAAHDLASAGI